MLRSPAVAGYFYPESAEELKDMLGEYLTPDPRPEPALMAVCPHAGYVYSGGVAGMVLARVQIPQRVLVAGPNHRGMGAAAALMSRGAWDMPFGQVGLDAELGRLLLEHCPLMREDHTAHLNEHSLEVQLPFLQTLRPDMLLSPLCLSHFSLDECLEMGRGMASAIKELGEPVLMVASTDMSHYEPAEKAEEKDMAAIGHILDLDPEGLYETVARRAISMCGVLPTVVLLEAAKNLGAETAELIHYTNSGHASGNFREVVGYAGLIVK